MAWKYCDEIIKENDIYDIVADNYDMNDFEDYLNDETVTVCGYEYGQGTALRRLDPVAFKCAYDDETDYMAREIIYNKFETDFYDFGIEYIEDDEE